MLKIYPIQYSVSCLIIILLSFCNCFAYANDSGPAIEKESTPTAGPVAVCAANVNVAVGNDCTVVLQPEFIDEGSFDPDGDPITLALDLTEPVGVGIYTVILSVSDGTSTTQCFSNVIVEDKFGPTAVCISMLNLSLSSDGTGTLFPDEVDGGSTDNCGVNLSFADGPITYTCEDVGTIQTVTLLVSDDAGNTNNCWSDIVIEDVGNFCNQAPVAVCAASVNVAVDNDCTVVLQPEFIDAGSFDPDGDPITLALDLTEPVGVGTYTVVLSVSDGTSTTQCFSNVIVEDKSGPTAVCIGMLNLSLSSDGTGTLFPDEVDGGSTDNCGVNLSFADGPITYTCEDVGTIQTVTLLVSDDAGNTNNCWSDIVIEDVGGFCNQAPVAACLAGITATTGPDCIASVLATDLDAGSFDPDGDPIALNLTPSGPFTPGNYTLILEVSDGELTSTCTTALTLIGLDNDGDGFACDEDCNDNNTDVYPGAPELCDGLDNDCDNSVDEPFGINSTNIWAEAVALNTINNVSGNNGGYADFTALSTNLVTGTSYSITLTPGVFNFNRKLKWRVYLDLDQDGEFSNGVERVVQEQSTTPVTASFTIPSDTPTGSITLRVTVSDKYQQGCDDNYLGETEDYTVNITNSSSLVSVDNQPPLALIERVSGEHTSIKALQLTPNPVTNVVQVRAKVEKENADLIILDQMGRNVYQQNWPAEQSVLQLDVQAIALQSGLYFVVVQTASGRQTGKLIVN